MKTFNEELDSFSRNILNTPPLLKSKNPVEPAAEVQAVDRQPVLTIDDILAVSVDNTGNLLKLKEQFSRIPPIPYIGAGLSLVPSWKGLIQKISDWMQIKSEEFQNELKQNRFEQAAQLLYETRPELFYQALEDILSPRRIARNGDNLSSTLKILPYLCKGVLLTTNFDRCIEQAFRRYELWHMTPGEMPVSQLEVELPALNINELRHRIQGDEHFLLKLHGDALSGQANLVFTRDQYDQYYGISGIRGINKKPMRRMLREILLARSLLFLGCSLEKDRSMDILLDEASKQDVRDVRGYSFAIVQKSSDEVKFREKREFLTSMRIRPIWYPEGQHEYIAVVLKDIIADKYLKHLQEHRWYDRLAKGDSPDISIGESYQ